VGSPLVSDSSAMGPLGTGHGLGSRRGRTLLRDYASRYPIRPTERRATHAG
jgi:hypothetical protein